MEKKEAGKVQVICPMPSITVAKSGVKPRCPESWSLRGPETTGGEKRMINGYVGSSPQDG